MQKYIHTGWLAAQLLVKRIPYILITALCLYGIVYLTQLTFYRYAPPSFFLNIKSATISSAQVTQPLELTFCRNARATYNDATANRAFFKLEGDKRIVAGEYRFQVDYERGDNCQIIPIAANRHPQVEGTYYAETTIRFPVTFDSYVFFKEATYRTTIFRLSDTVQGLQDQIRGLEQEIESLKAILRARGVVIPDRVTVVTMSPTSAAPVNGQQTTNPPASPPVATAPPDPDVIVNPQRPGFVTMLVDGTVKTVTETTGGVLKVVDDATSGILPNGIL